MYSSNDSNSEQNYIYCRNNCGVRITFRDNAISKNGRKIPLQENGLPHNCPKSHFNRRQRQVSDPKQDLHSDNLSRKITPEQQLYVDTVGSAIAEILSLVQEIYKHTVRDARNDE